MNRDTFGYDGRERMARPRIFISSTFYDLRHVRNDLDRFIAGLGYEAIMNERGTIPYGSTERLEQYCYRELQNSDAFVAIIGGRYGAASENQPYSISQQEFKTAYELGRQVYIFVESNVLRIPNVYEEQDGYRLPV